MAKQQSGETEYQGQFLAWLKADLQQHSYAFEDATQEFPNAAGKRSDVIVWVSRAANHGFLEIELKTPATPLSDKALQKDAIRKARIVKAPYLALSNMRDTAIFKTPAAPREGLLADDLIKQFDPIQAVTNVADWIDPDVESLLRRRAHEILVAAHDLQSRGSLDGVVVDATVFVDALKLPVNQLSAVLKADVKTALAQRKKGKQLNDWATEQGLIFFVSDLATALAGQIAYRITGQILFYYAFRRHQGSLSNITLDESSPVSVQLRVFWDQVRAFDYEALFEPSPLEAVELSAISEGLVRSLVDNLAGYDWNDVELDVLGSIFEQLIPVSERIVLGQYYTPPRLADLLLSLSVEDEPSAILDPAVGSGTFLLRAYSRLRKKHQWSHEDALDHLWGTDISAFPAELAVINLCRQDLTSHTNYPRIMVRDFFRLSPDETVRVPVAKPLAGGSTLVDTPLPKFRSIVGNPPYVRSQQLDDLNSAYKQMLHRMAAKNHTDDSKFDAFAYFLLHSIDFLEPGGQLGFVTSASWLTTAFGARLQRFMLEHFKIKAIIFSRAEPFFPYQSVNTVAVAAERRATGTTASEDEAIRFITLLKPLEDLFPDPERSDYWNSVDLTCDDMLDADAGEYDNYKVSLRNAHAELQSLKNEPNIVRNWGKPFKESGIYREVFEGGSPHTLDEFADINLGQKTLLNDFFYVDADTAEKFGIEDRYLKPIYLLENLDPRAYFQNDRTSTYVFECREIPSDLRGTGAGRYVKWGAQQTTAGKKQSGTLKEKWPNTDNMKSKRYWYWPSDVLKERRIGLRKGIGMVHAPFLFDDPVAFDQRLYVARSNGISDEILAAYFSSTAFALSLEVAADFGLGGGVLSVGTRAMRSLSAPDLKLLEREPHREAILSAARTLHSATPPTASNYPKHAALRALDEAVLHALGIDSSRAINLEEESATLATARQAIQILRKRAAAITADVNVSTVAANVASRLEHWLAPRSWPDDSIKSTAKTEKFDFPVGALEVDVNTIMGMSTLRITTTTGGSVLTAEYPEAVSEVIVRALQWGRRHFLVPDLEEVAEETLAELRKLVAELDEAFRVALAATGVGIRFEEDVKRRALETINVDLRGLKSEFLSGSWTISAVPFSARFREPHFGVGVGEPKKMARSRRKS
jgi:methylase of polypeptide subunit release factors